MHLLLGPRARRTNPARARLPSRAAATAACVLAAFLPNAAYGLDLDLEAVRLGVAEHFAHVKSLRLHCELRASRRDRGLGFVNTEDLVLAGNKRRRELHRSFPGSPRKPFTLKTFDGEAMRFWGSQSAKGYIDSAPAGLSLNDTGYERFWSTPEGSDRTWVQLLGCDQSTLLRVDAESGDSLAVVQTPIAPRPKGAWGAGGLTLTAWVSLRKGFAPVRWEAKKADGELAYSATLTQLEPAGQGHFVPAAGKQYLRFYYNSALGSATEGPFERFEQDYEFQASNLHVNEPVDPREFVLKFPEGTEVHDARTMTLYVVKDGALRSEVLDKVAEDIKAAVAERPRTRPAAGQDASARAHRLALSYWWAVAAGCGIVLLVLGGMLKALGIRARTRRTRP